MLQYSHQTHPFYKMHLHISKNNRTFEVLTELERFNSKFLNPNKTQATRCKSCNFRFFGSVSSDLGFYLQTKSHMLTEKKTPREIYNPQIIKTELEEAGTCAIYVQFGPAKAIIRCPVSDMEKAIASILKPCKQQ